MGAKMNRSSTREETVKLLYLISVNGQYNPGDYSEEVLHNLADISERLDDIDTIISDNLIDWTIDRLNYVDKAIIRYAIYEMKYCDLPYEIAIDEAVELTKKYSNLDDDQAKSFNNRLLDNIRKKIIGDRSR
jgi:N utilization substance protein B